MLNELLALGPEHYGEPRYIDAVILFSDIRGFTETSAELTPDVIAADLGAYFDAVVDVIHGNGGLVDKFVGDAVMAIWGFRASGDDLAVQAVTCAGDMLRTAGSMTFGGHPIKIGIGLNAGRVFIGNVGGDGKRQFTVLGTPVNVAARLEAKSKDLRAPIVLGEPFAERLPDDLRDALHEHRDIELKGVGAVHCFTWDGTDPHITDGAEDKQA